MVVVHSVGLSQRLSTWTTIITLGISLPYKSLCTICLILTSPTSWGWLIFFTICIVFPSPECWILSVQPSRLASFTNKHLK